MSFAYSSIRGIAARITRLDALGAPVLFDGSVYVIRTFLSVRFSPEYTDGAIVPVRTANSLKTRNLRLPATLTRVTIDVSVAAPDVQLAQILENGISLAADSGYSGPESTVPASRDVAVEIISSAVDNDKIVGYWRWLFPYVNLRLTSEMAVEENIMLPVYSGWSRPNAAFGAGPAEDWPSSAGRAYQYIFESAAAF